MDYLMLQMEILCGTLRNIISKFRYIFLMNHICRPKIGIVSVFKEKILEIFIDQSYLNFVRIKSIFFRIIILSLKLPIFVGYFMPKPSLQNSSDTI